MKHILGLDPDPFAQQLRRAHCAHARAKEADHACVGSCLITRDGVTLSCEACGDGDEPLVPYGRVRDHARMIVEAAGMRWESLSPEAQRAAIGALEKGPR